jgi:hypothetical protein
MLGVIFVVAILGAMAGLIGWELYQEAQGSHHELHDHYHEG